MVDKKTDKTLAIPSSYSMKIEGHPAIMFPDILGMRVYGDKAAVY